MVVRQRRRRKRTSGSDAAYHLSVVQLHCVIAAGKTTRDRLLMRLFAETGIRRFEAVNLRVEDMNRPDALLVVRYGKGEKSRLVPLTEELLEDLRRFVDRRVTGPLFLSRHDRRLSERQVNRIVARAGEDAGVNNPNPRRHNVTCHLFRHSFARLWKNAAGSMESLSYILGHSSQATTLDLYGREGISDVKCNYRRTINKISRSCDTTLKRKEESNAKSKENP